MNPWFDFNPLSITLGGLNVNFWIAFQNDLRRYIKGGRGWDAGGRGVAERRTRGKDTSCPDCDTHHNTAQHSTAQHTSRVPWTHRHLSSCGVWDQLVASDDINSRDLEAGW